MGNLHLTKKNIKILGAYHVFVIGFTSQNLADFVTRAEAEKLKFKICHLNNLKSYFTNMFIGAN